jgi:DNA-binding transcriptional MerR regulator
MFSIGHVAKATGVKIPTIRFYEHEGLLPAPARAENNRRVYSDADIRTKRTKSRVGNCRLSKNACGSLRR